MTTISRLSAVLATLALAGVLCAPAVAEEELGRLFFTPEKRQVLDHQRAFNIQEKQEIPKDPTFKIDGVVTRSSGKQTIWVDGRAVGEDDADIRVVPKRKNPGRVEVNTKETPIATAKVGDTVHRDTGETTDLLQGGRISIHRPIPSR